MLTYEIGLPVHAQSAQLVTVISNFKEKKKKNFKLNMVAHASNPKIHADEAGGLLIQVQSGI